VPDPRLEGSFYESESSKYLALTVPYLVGNGVDIGSGGWPVVPWAIQIELPAKDFEHYTNGRRVSSTTEWLGDILSLPFKDGVLDWVYSSHLIEDFCREDTDQYPITWHKLFREWGRCLKPGGFMVLLVPDRERWAAAIARGQPPNNSHFAPEPSVGDISKAAKECGFEVVEDRLTDFDWKDYSMLGVLRKPL
jgi:SAM-dependent methyltransferase